MKRLIWIATKDRERFFEELWNESELLPRFYDIEQVPNLVAFIARSKVVAEQDFFVVDLSDAAYPAEQILDAVKMLWKLSAARPIFISPDCEETTALYGRLANEGVRNVILARPNTDLREEMRCCISENGKDFASRITALQRGMAAQAKAQVQPLIMPEGLCITCAVVGTMPRIGVTTQAIALCRYLSALGCKPLLIDGTHRLRDTLQIAYSDRVTEGGSYIELDGLYCSTDTCEDESFNARIIDMGVLADDRKVQTFQAADFRLLVSGIKPWELQPFAVAKKRLEGIEFSTCVSFGDAEELERLRRYFGENTELAPWHPSPLHIGNTTHFSRLILPHLREVCHA